MTRLPPGPEGLRSKTLALRGLRERPLDFIVEMSEQFGDLVHFESQRDLIFFVIFPYVIHRDARWFTRPVLFDPDRFPPENLGVVQRSAYMPLGLGPHVCLGKALSTIILTTMLACILREYRVTLPWDHPELKPEVGIVIRPGGDLRLIATRVVRADPEK